MQTALNCSKGGSYSRVEISGFKRITGGDINQTYQLEFAETSPLFIKLNNAQKLSMFEAEKFALKVIYNTKSLKIPKPIISGVFTDTAYLVMEYIDFGQANDRSYTEFGRQLAKMHRTTQNNFGFEIDNTIGCTLQQNSSERSWVNFWRDKRMLPQLILAQKNGAPSSIQHKADRLLERLEDFFPFVPKPSLLHGDLWAGNYAVDGSGHPVIYDPASYYGDRECDIAMTELFGRCPASFYIAYNEAWPLIEGYERRRTLYNLYHIINHFNLFGGAYAVQAENMLDKLL